ncbi:MAG: hypothetical protein CM1200mP18_20190 [Gammaproteobacteria bacterium]|nr:MAG: hypothetical protein CM1200mP18_20190 [Gammaproteobacteria bacterium]
MKPARLSPVIFVGRYLVLAIGREVVDRGISTWKAWRQCNRAPPLQEITQACSCIAPFINGLRKNLNLLQEEMHCGSRFPDYEAVKCLPPENRPIGSEVRNCIGFIGAEIQDLPKGAVILGTWKSCTRCCDTSI